VGGIGALCLALTTSNVAGTHKHGPVGFEQSSVQLLGSSEFYHLPMGIEYSGKDSFGKVV
jgi:hypothetical protein